MQEIRVGLIGFGTVGSGLAEVLACQQARLAQRSGLQIRLVKVADISRKDLGERFQDVALTNDAAALINDPDIDIVVELIGGMEPAKTFILQAIAAGKHVVTANKALLSEAGSEIFAAAAKKGVEVGFEASVGGGIPVLKSLREGLVANEICSIMGILNGTANFILTKMTDEGTPFEAVLKEAQEEGFAEADPTYDVEGIDTAHKLVILMTMAYGIQVGLKDLSIEGISAITPLDIDFAREFGYRIKLLAISENHGDHVEARVHPTMVPERHLLANIDGAYNAVHFNGDMVGNVLLYGPGAGQMPTGSAVAADVVDIARNIQAKAVDRVPALAYLPSELKAATITPMSDLSCPYYLRISTQDEPGVLAKMAALLADEGISIESVIQKGRKTSGPVSVVIRTHTAKEDALQRALAEIDELPTVTAPTVKIRIMVDEAECWD